MRAVIVQLQPFGPSEAAKGPRRRIRTSLLYRRSLTMARLLQRIRLASLLQDARFFQEEPTAVAGVSSSPQWTQLPWLQAYK